MRCSNCGAEIPNHEFRCAFCGEEVQMVPDYNPLEEVVTSQVRNSITGKIEPIDYERRRSLEQKNKPSESKNRPDISAKEAAIRRRKQAERNRAIKRKRRKLAIILVAVSVILISILSIFIQRNSYSGLINRGNKAYEEHNVTEAELLYQRAISKKPGKCDAYLALTELYYSTEEYEKAEGLLLKAAKDNPKNEEIHMAVIDFYMDTNQDYKIMEFYNQCTKDMKEVLDAYNSITPTFSLKSGTYDDVQELSLTADGSIIYYTDDGTEPTKESLKYEAPIQLKEGTTVITAIAYNKEWVPSAIKSGEYEIVLPIEGAPIVNPSTGQYKEKIQIVVTVPDGYEAYYTMDGSTPSANSKKYNDAIDMPEGNTIFSAVLINSSGKTSDITKRNYSLVIEKDDED